MAIKKTGRAVAILLFYSTIVAATASGRDLADVDFSLRFPATLARFSPYSDVAGVGGASAASRYASSVNPAAIGWPSSPLPIAVSPQYSAILFNHGPTIHVIDEAATYLTKDAGTFQIAAVQIVDQGSKVGNFLLLNGNYAQLQWGKKLNDWFSIGLNFNYTSFDTSAGSDGATLSDGHSDTYTARLGMSSALSDQLRFGIVVDKSFAPSGSNSFDAGCGCTVELSDNTRETLVRPGIAYEYAEQSSIYVDFQYGDYRNSTGRFVTRRFFTGVEHRYVPWLFGRVGLAYDLRGAASPTVGIGIYPSPAFSVDVVFQSNMFNEINPEFGRSKVVGISAAASF